MTLYCIICGRSEDEALKMFCFPRNAERLQLWKEGLGVIYQGHMSGNQRVCDAHFTKDCFITPVTLRSDAIPTILPAKKLIEYHQDQDMPSTSTKGISTAVQPSGRVALHATAKSKSVRGKTSLFKDIKSLCSDNTSTTKEKKLMSIIKNKEKYIRNLKTKCRARGAKIKDLSNIHKSIEVNNIFKGMSSIVAQFMVAQIRCSKRSPHGRTWTLDDKIVSLAIYKRSPRCYSLLRRLLALPSRRTLTLLLQKVPFDVGINNHIFKHLGECLSKHPEKDRICSLAFDEMAIREHIQYNPSKDCIEGVEDYGNYRTDKMANYALVFFAQGIGKRWKQPVAYYFSNGGVTSVQLEALLKDVLRAMQDNQIPVIATVCDMGSANVKCLKNLGSNILNPSFTFLGRQIFTVFDIPHLLKCIRNLFKKYNILVPTITVDGIECKEMLQARWSDIATAYEEDKRNPLIFRSLRKIKDSYLAPLRQNAMKVKVAAQTLSSSVSVYIFNLVRLGILPSRALATASFIHDVDQLFDSCNGTAKEGFDEKPYKCIVTNKSSHVSFWEKASKKVNQWKFIRNPQDLTNSSHWKPPSQIGWQHTLHAFQKIWSCLQTLGFNSFCPRALNQDGLENLFGSIRSGCGCNENPTVTQFVASLKTQIINGLTQQDLQGTNCEEDDLSLLSNLRSFLESGSRLQTPSETPSNINPTVTPDIGPSHSEHVAMDIERLVASGTMESLSVAYVSGFIVRRLFVNFTCEGCKLDLLSDDLEPCNQFISMKEFSATNNKLFYPSQELVVTVGRGITLLEAGMLNLLKDTNIHKKAALELTKQVDFSWLNTCSTHHEYIKECVIKSICRIGIPWYCKRRVRDLRSEAKKQATERKQKKLHHV